MRWRWTLKMLYLSVASLDLFYDLGDNGVAVLGDQRPNRHRGPMRPTLRHPGRVAALTLDELRQACPLLPYQAYRNRSAAGAATPPGEPRTQAHSRPIPCGQISTVGRNPQGKAPNRGAHRAPAGVVDLAGRWVALRGSSRSVQGRRPAPAYAGGGRGVQLLIRSQ